MAAGIAVLDIKDNNDMKKEEIEHTGPARFIVVLFLVLLLVVWIFAPYIIITDPEPKYIPTIDEVLVSNLSVEQVNHTINSRQDFAIFTKPDTQIKDIAVKIASLACDSQKVCQAKAVYYFVRDNFDYVSDPDFEYIESPKEVLITGGSDCDGMAVFLAALEKAIGVDARLVFVPGHVYVELRLDEGPGKYQIWFPADATCSSCRFGEIPEADGEKQYIFLS
jgi:transglutaminase-like putative cysteine protease